MAYLSSLHPALLGAVFKRGPYLVDAARGGMYYHSWAAQLEAASTRYGGAPMQLPEYVSTDEVKRVCAELGFKDWSALMEPPVSEEEASVILGIVDTKGMNILWSVRRICRCGHKGPLYH